MESFGSRQHQDLSCSEQSAKQFGNSWIDVVFIDSGDTEVFPVKTHRLRALLGSKVEFTLKAVLQRWPDEIY